MEIETNALPSQEAIPLGKLAAIAENNVMDDIEIAKDGDVELEAFMQEPIEIEVMRDTNPAALQEFDLCVNGFKQRIVRGKPQKVRRMFVEALARSRVVDYEQRPFNPMDDSSLEMQPVAIMTYPFQILRDPNPKGRPWIENIMRQR